MGEPKRVLAVMAHPDDIEFLCAGTLIRLHHEAGCHITLASATTGYGGSVELRGEEIARIRHGEARASAAVIDADYLCADCMDVLVTYDRPTVLKFIELVRVARPHIVITHNPIDYMLDHEMTSKLVRAATFAAPVHNLITEVGDSAEPIETIPYLYYADPVELLDHAGKQVEPEFIVDISSVIDTKQQMLTCHASQRDWLRNHHGIDHYVITMREMSAARGKQINATFGEGFGQYKAHAYPRDNIIQDLLSDGRR